MESISDIEKIIEIRIIQEDAETILSLMSTERDSIFGLAILPYYALFIQSVQEYIGESLIEEASVKQLKDIRNYIKALDTGLNRSKKRINEVDAVQDKEFRSQLRFDFMKPWNVHYNLGTYWTKDKHVLGNTQMYADYLGVKAISSDETKEKLYDVYIGRERHTARSFATSFPEF